MRFCLLFGHPIDNVHLTKEVCKIPEAIGRNLGWHAEIVRCAGEVLRGTEREIPHVVVRDVPGYADGRLERHFIRYLIDNARKIDVLLLLHFDRNTAVYGSIYKLFNPHGFLWNKLDLDEQWLATAELVPPASWRLRRIARRLLQRFFEREVDLISAESRGVYQAFAARFAHLKSKVGIVPSGVDAQCTPMPIEHFDREKFILTVARLGSEPKATDVLLEAFARSGLWPEWTLVLVGPVEPAFVPWLDAFQAREPSAWNAVRLVGPVASREKLAEWYLRSSVFCLPSLHESWGLALNEAGYYGCASIASDFCAAQDMLDDGRCGALCEKGSVEDLALALGRVLR